MRFAYADPPYLGKAALLYGEEARDFDTLDTHAALIRGMNEMYDGWAMSLNTSSLQAILPLCPEGVRVLAWVKPFASFKPNVNPAYAWEPVILHNGRARTRETPTVRDWVSVPITLRKGLVGAKPRAFCLWLFEVAGLSPDDEFVDLFPGTGAVGDAWESWRNQASLLQRESL